MRDFERAGCHINQNIFDCYLHLQEEGLTGGVGLENKLFSIGGAAKHLTHSLGDCIAIDAIDLEQLMRFAAARNVGNSQTMQVKAGLIDHG